MRKVIIIQARMSSTRLPGKVLADLCGKPMLSRQIQRLREVVEAPEITVATSDRSVDDPVVELARGESVEIFRGSEEDVLSRFVGAAREMRADLVVRVTADCPLIDPGEVDRAVRALLNPRARVDYASNVIQRTYPRGLDVEALFSDTLERLHRLAESPKSREHVTWFINRERPDLFQRASVVDSDDNSDLRWTVDTPQDLAAVRKIYEELDLGARVLPYRQVLAYVRAHPQLAALNADVPQKDA